MSDVEKLIERLEDCIEANLSEHGPQCCRTNMHAAAAMLRKVEAQRKELELELWKWPALMNEVRAKLKDES